MDPVPRTTRAFEIGPGENGEPVAGWENSGNVGRGNGLTAHGSWAAWLYGPFNGNAGISRLHITVECTAGWQHRLAVSAGHRGADALVGAARAAFTVTWLDGTGVSLGVDSVILLNADSPVNEMIEINETLRSRPSWYQPYAARVLHSSRPRRRRRGEHM